MALPGATTTPGSLGTGPSNSNVSATLRVTQACDDARKFVDLYYQRLDKGRHLLGGLYHDQATLVWNGNSVASKAAILQFYEQLPISETELMSLDAQPVTEIHENPYTMITVTCSGRQKLGNNRPECFTETFLLVAENQVWKVISDAFRTY